MARIKDNQEIINLIRNVEFWYHQIELAPGIVTPGVNDSSAVLRNLEALGLPDDCSGLRVLDIGCRDGFFSFAMEARGAAVTGVDYAPSNVTGFEVAARVLDSKVEYVVENVYDLGPQKYGRFDLVLFLGVLYHLRNPLLALDRIRQMLNLGGLLFVECQLSTDERVNSLDIPIWQFYPRATLNDDETNKWAPNLPGLGLVVEEAEFTVQDSMVHGSRGYIKAMVAKDERQEYFRQLDTSKGIFGVNNSLK
jgi:tRNA (mo5U34)-methyltransferase